MFEKIFIESLLKENPQTLKIQNYFKTVPVEYIDDWENVYGKVKVPYLRKRDSLNLFLGTKKGTLVKKAPDAYGFSSDPHYYFVHSYNCIYECEYCYLQGYFHSPDIVLFLNHEDIKNEIVKVVHQESHSNAVWFHAGEYSDSLALAHLSGEFEKIFEVFYDYPQAKLELRTKSVNIKPLLKLKPSSNIFVSFSLSPQHRIEKSDLRTPSLKLRLAAMKELVRQGYKLAIHFDPIILDDLFPQSYEALIQQVSEEVGWGHIEYISLGVVRFTKDVYHHVQKNYPQSDLHIQEFVKSFDNKVRYIRPLRLWMLGKIQSLLVRENVSVEKIYMCMEETSNTPIV